MKLYHVTPEKNLDNIRSNGLLPRSKCGLRGLSGNGGEKWRREVVWLTNDPDYILDTQASPNWIELHKPVTLVIDASTLIMDRINKHEYIVYGMVENTRIKETINE